MTTTLWHDHLAEHLRLRGWSETQVADALDTVTAHCADAQQGPDQAFGEPGAYAAALTGNGLHRWGYFARRSLPSLAGLVGAILLFSNALHNGASHVSIPWGAAVTAVLAIVLVPFVVPALLQHRRGWDLDDAVRVAWMIAAAIGIACYWLAPTPAVSVPVLVVWPLAVALVYAAALATPTPSAPSGGGVLGSPRRRSVWFATVITAAAVLIRLLWT